MWARKHIQRAKPPASKETKAQSGSVTQDHTSQKCGVWAELYLSSQTLTRQLPCLGDHLGINLKQPKTKTKKTAKIADPILYLFLLVKEESLWQFWSEKHCVTYNPSAKRG